MLSIASNVISLNPSTLAEAMATRSIVVFHAPWCGFCKMLEPVVKDLAQQRPDIRVFRINASRYGGEMRKDAADFNNIMSDVTGFPTIVFFGNGKRRVHVPRPAGQRTVENIVAQYDAYQKENPQSAQPSEDMPSLDMSPTQVRGIRYGIVMFHKCGECVRFMPVFREFWAWAAEHADHVVVGTVECPNSSEGQEALAQEYGICGFPTIKVFHQKGNATDYEGVCSLEALKEYTHATFFNRVDRLNVNRDYYY